MPADATGSTEATSQTTPDPTVRRYPSTSRSPTRPRTKLEVSYLGSSTSLATGQDRCNTWCCTPRGLTRRPTSSSTAFGVYILDNIRTKDTTNALFALETSTAAYESWTAEVETSMPTLVDVVIFKRDWPRSSNDLQWRQDVSHLNGY